MKANKRSHQLLHNDVLSRKPRRILALMGAKPPPLGGSFSRFDEITLQAIMRTVGVLALITRLARFGLAAFDDLIAVTVRTQHGNEYHGALLLKQSAAWHTWG